MKKFIVSILCVATFFLGLGSLVNEVGAKFKSDERALDLMRQAREAVGGDANLRSVRSMTITGKTTHTFEIEGAQRTEQGDVEINLELPNKFGKMLKIGMENHGLADAKGEKKEFTVIMRSNDKVKVEAANGEGLKDKVVIMKKDGGEPIEASKRENGTFETSDGKKIILDKNLTVNDGGHRQNELLRTTLALLLSAPEGVDVGYTYGGEGNVDGNSVDIVNVENSGSIIKLYLDKSSHLPRMISYQGIKPVMMFKVRSDDAKANTDNETKVFTRHILNPETAEFQIKFSDYRSVNGVQLPYRWTQTVSGQINEVTDITAYEINPANIAEKFKNQKVFVRVPKEQQ